jgi:transglutaminase-like putative cysteine protease
VSPKSLAGPAAAAALASLVLGVAWAGLFEDVGAGHVAALCAVAALPAVAATAPRARVALIALAGLAASALALGLALRRSPLALLTLDGEAWGEARMILPRGLRDGSDTGLPASPAEHPELIALLDLALVALAATAAWQILVRRRPVAGLVAVGVGLAYRWTVEPPADPVLAGAIALAALAAVLALGSWEGGGAGRAARRAGGALALGGVAVAVAAGLGAGPAQAGDAWWSWKDWDIGGSGEGSGAALDLRQRYGKLDWPETPRVAMTVESDRPLPLRAVSLDEFDGIAFALADPSSAGPGRRLPVIDGGIDLEVGDDPDGEVFAQRITFVGASSQVLLASGRPQRVSGPFTGSADLVGGAIRLEQPLGPGDRYSVRTAVPKPAPADLVADSGYDPAQVPEGATRLRPGFWERAVDIPLWGSGDAAPDGALLGSYARVRDLARSVAGDAQTPYAAVNRIESHLRRGYVYDERPPYPTSLPDDWSAGLPEGQPPLVDFLFGSRRGFCQHFAGSMAVMLRSIGIPARVAVGYTGGRFDRDRDAWVVLDRDAHSWVEVWFPGHGWLAFDPTPGRAAPNPASVSSPDYAPSAFDIDLGGLEDTAVAPPEPDPATPRPESEPEADGGEAEPAGAAAGGGGGPPWQWALLALALPAAVAPVARGMRRARGRRRGDERARVTAAAREFEASLRSLGWAPSPAGSASERAAAVRSRTGVDPTALYRRASQARYAPGPLPPGAAAGAWRELARLRRAVRRRAPVGRRVRAALGLGRPPRGTVFP